MTDTELAQLVWDIDSLVDNRGADGVRALLDEASKRAEALAEQKGKLANFDAEALAAFMTEYGEVQEVAGRAGSFAHLWFSTDTGDPERGALMQEVQERATEIGTRLLFFELEWAQLPDEKVDELLADPRLDQARHHLQVLRRFRDYLLSEPEEKILAEKSVTGRAAWTRLHSELSSAMTVDLDG